MKEVVYTKVPQTGRKELEDVEEDENPSPPSHRRTVTRNQISYQLTMAGRVFPATSANAALITIAPGDVTASSEIPPDFNRKDDFIVDGSGLTGGQHTNVVEPNMWLSTGDAFGGQDLDPSVTFDLGAVYTINSFHVWNYNELTGSTDLTGRGVNGVAVEYGVTAGLGSTVPGIASFAQADSTATYAGEAFNTFTPFNARFIKFDINSNHGGDNNFYGLSEVRFDGVLVPEPATFLLATFGLLGLRRRTRRA